MRIGMIFIKKHCKFLLFNDENHVYFYEYGYYIVVVGVGKLSSIELSIRIPTQQFALLVEKSSRDLIQFTLKFDMKVFKT